MECTYAQTKPQSILSSERVLGGMESEPMLTPWEKIPSTGKKSQRGLLLLIVGCVTSKQHARVSQGRICSDNCTCCYTEIEVADQTFHLTQYTDTGPTSPSTDPITPGAWQGGVNFSVTGMTRPRKKSRLMRDSNPGSSTLEVDALTTRPEMQIDPMSLHQADKRAQHSTNELFQAKYKVRFELSRVESYQ